MKIFWVCFHHRPYFRHLTTNPMESEVLNFHCTTQITKSPSAAVFKYRMTSNKGNRAASIIKHSSQNKNRNQRNKNKINGECIRGKRHSIPCTECTIDFNKKYTISVLRRRSNVTPLTVWVYDKMCNLIWLKTKYNVR